MNPCTQVKSLLTLLLFTFVSAQLFAQSNFKPGYIVTLNGDTAKGFVDYREWNQNPREISFKTTEQPVARQYSTAKLTAFGVDLIDHYKRYVGPITQGAVDLANLSNGVNTTKITDTIFLRTIIAGSKVTLYGYNDVIKNRFFIAEANANPTELEWYVYRDNSNSSSIVERKVYQEQLKIIADKYQPGNATLANRIQRASYQTNEMQKIIAAINGLNEVPKIAIAKREEIKFFVGAAANFNQTTFSSTSRNSNADMFSAGVKTQSVGPSFTGGLDYYFNRNSGKLIFRFELAVGINKITGFNEHPFVDAIRVFNVKETFNANQLNISLNPQVIYNLVNNNKLKFYLAGGAQFNKLSYSNSYYYLDFYENNALNKRNEVQLQFRGLYLTPTFKAGLVLPNIAEIYVGYNAPAEILNNTSLSASLSTFKLGLNYHFGTK
ncbi:hypothetical protein ACFQZS_15025 [Mucilaginibacter calamicampi]|uniref:Outer membrane protein beta-barrel domain-containing protein n=1 Tax=Mucilaginibacter calamicampi TaxID=1302352 RepID=A0ABW2YY93_9SPHI